MLTGSQSGPNFAIIRPPILSSFIPNFCIFIRVFFSFTQKVPQYVRIGAQDLLLVLLLRSPVIIIMYDVFYEALFIKTT